MNKTIRILLILALLVGIVVVAGSKTVWASSAPASPLEKVNPAPAAVASNIGTVDVPDGERVVIGNGEDPVSIGGQATLEGLDVNTNVLTSLSPRPDGYLSKIVNLLFTSGSARLCFPAVKGDETVYILVGDVWTPLFTFYVNNLACVEFSESGSYVLGQ